MRFQLDYATSADSTDIAVLFREIVSDLSYYNEQARAAEISKYTAEELAAKVAEDPYSVIVVKKENEVVGYCLSRFDDYTIWLEWFGVHPSHRREGIGKLILEKLEESARWRECHKVWCGSRTVNIKSYQTLMSGGFSVVAALKNHWYGQDFLLWEKLL